MTDEMKTNRDSLDQLMPRGSSRPVRHVGRLDHLFFGVLGALLGLALGFALFTHDHVAHTQMDCAEDQVQVWADFEAGTTRCVGSDDHGAHVGH